MAHSKRLYKSSGDNHYETSSKKKISGITKVLMVSLLVVFGLQTALAEGSVLTNASVKIPAKIAVKVAVKPVQPFYKPLVKTQSPVTYEPTVTYISPLKEAPIKFSSIGAVWHQKLPPGTTIQLAVRLRTKNQVSDWYDLDPSIDFKENQTKTAGSENLTSDNGYDSYPTALLTANESDGFQYKITLTTKDSFKTPLIDQLKFSFIHGGTPNQKAVLAQDTLTQENFSPSEISELDETIPDSIDSDSILGIKHSSQDQLKNESQAGNLVSGQLYIKTSALTASNSNFISYETPKTPTNKVKRKTTSPKSTGKLKVISRADWGADENLRILKDDLPDAKLVSLNDDYYKKFADELKIVKTVTTDENGKNLTWPLTYPAKVSKIVIHHTASTKDLDDPKRAIRDIYYWHTITKGWGDIGYNYIIDPKGNIYEGRYGGESVIGAHAGKGNTGSIGIAILGNYQDEDPPEPILTSLVTLLKEKTAKYKIDPQGASLFRGEKYPNIMGHRDIMSTACPGDRLYAMLPIIRKMVKLDFNKTVDKAKNLSNDYNFTFVDQPKLQVVAQQAKKVVSFNIKNTGTKTWNANTYFQINPQSDAKIFLENSTKIISDKIGKEVKPNQTVQVKFSLSTGKTGGSGLIEITPIINGTVKVERYLQFPLQVTTPITQLPYDYTLLSIVYNKPEFKKGDTLTATIKLRNKGTKTWVKNGQNKFMLGTDNPRDHYTALLATPAQRLAGLEEDTVKTNEIATFIVKLKVPNSDGTYKEYFTPVVEGVTWLTNKNTYLQIVVGGKTDAPQSVNDEVVENNSNTSKSTNPTIASVVTTTKNSTKPGTNGVNQSSKNIAATKLDLNKAPAEIRVDLSYRGNPAIISGSGNFSLYESSKKLADFSKDDQVTIQLTDNKFTVSHNQSKWTLSSNPRFVPQSSTILRIENWDRKNGAKDSSGNQIKDNEFRGKLEVLVYDKELHVVNELPLEDYLKGIAEESSREPLEKIKAIMIIARTYARFYMEIATKFPGAPFNLNDDPNYSQKYIGYSFEKRSPVTAKIADDTRGKVLTYQGKLIKTPYFSQSAGKTINAFDKWGWTDAPFLQSVKDEFCATTELKGHGVGLSGCGAKKLADQGKTFTEILKYYYQGVEVSKVNY